MYTSYIIVELMSFQMTPPNPSLIRKIKSDRSLMKNSTRAPLQKGSIATCISWVSHRDSNNFVEI
jgi:hypothetical protein